MKFLHTADLHLDSAFCAATPIEAEQYREEQRSMLVRIFELAGAEECDMILIAGDLFDTVFVTPETARLCIELFSSFEKPIIISPGNHDPYVEGGFYRSFTLPENVYVFSSPELQCFDIPDTRVSVAGYAFTSSALPRDPLDIQAIHRENAENILLLCAHADVNAPTSRYAPVLSSDIERLGFDYAALGHVHNPPHISDKARYSGFPQGRGFDEEGEGGVYIVTVDKNETPIVQRRVISTLRFKHAEVCVDGADSPEEIESRVKDELNTYAKQGITHLRLELYGVVSPDATSDIEKYQKAPGTDFRSLSVIDATLALPDGAYLEKDVTLRGELYRTLRPLLFSDDSAERLRALRALRIGLLAIEGKNFTDGGRA